MPPNLFETYKAAGSAGADLIKEKQDVLDIGYKRQFHGEKHKMEMESLQDTIGSITEGITAVDTLYGGYQSKKKYGEAETEVQTGMAKEAYGRSEAGKSEGATKWSDLGEEGRSEWMGKFTPSEKPQAWHEKIFGVEKEYRFGEKVEGKEGKDLSEYYSKSDILAKGTLSKTTRLGKKSGIEDKSPFTFNLDNEVGGLKDKHTDDKHTDYVTPSGEGEGYGETQGFGSDWMNQDQPSDYVTRPEEDETMGQANKRFLGGGGQVGDAFDWRGKQYKSW